MKPLFYLFIVPVAVFMNACYSLPPEQVKVEQGIVAGTIEDGLRVLDNYFAWRGSPEGKAWAE